MECDRQTFGPEGPNKCRGLEVVRYDAESLHQEFGLHFRLLDSCKEMHCTPFGTVQQFLYCLCRIEAIRLLFAPFCPLRACCVINYSAANGRGCVSQSTD